MICFGCEKDLPNEVMTDVTRKSIFMCPQCAFILGLYHKSGIPKKIVHGSLKLSIINNQFRKIVTEEFSKDPMGTYDKYLKEMFDAEMDKAKIIHIAEKYYTAIEQESPFLMLTDNEAKRISVKAGDEVTIRCEEKEMVRKVYSVTQVNYSTAKKYSGSKLRRNVCVLEGKDE